MEIWRLTRRTDRLTCTWILVYDTSDVVGVCVCVAREITVCT